MAMLITSEVFLPIFYKLEITSTFEVRVLFLPLFSALCCVDRLISVLQFHQTLFTMKCLHVKDNFELLSRKGQRHLITVALLCKQKACVRLGKKQNKNDTDGIKSTSFLWTEIDKIQYGQVTW